MKISPWATGTVKVALLSAAFALPASGIAMAGTWGTSGNGSILGGNQVNVPVNVPVNVCGNAVALLGLAAAGCEGGASVSGHPGNSDRWSTSGNGSIAGGNQVNVPVNAPINVCGNAVAAAGITAAGCKGGSSVKFGHHGDGHGSIHQTSGDGSILGGNQVNVPVNVPVNVCGNALALLGIADAACVGGASVKGGGTHGVWETSGHGSVGGGNQISVPVNAPVDVCGNAVAVAGISRAGCKGGANVTTWTGHNKPCPPRCKCHPKPRPCPSKPGHPAKPGHPSKPGHPARPAGPGTSGSTTTTASMTTPSSGLLPTTGADLAGLAAIGLGAIGAGAASVVAMRRRRATSRF
jgi:LPXTG-motif cell wall-anchored protein